MKKTVSIFLAAVIFITLPLSVFAAVNVKDSVSKSLTYLKENVSKADNFDDTLSFAEAGLVTDTMKIFTVDLSAESQKSFADAENFAKGILLNQTFGLPSRTEKEDYGETLVSMQNEDGSFGNLLSTVYSVGALLSINKTPDKTSKKPYDDVSAINFIISSQKEDGSFGDLDLTVKATDVLLRYQSSEKAKNSIDKAAEYFKSFSESDDVTTLSYALMGLVDVYYGSKSDEEDKIAVKLINLQKEDGSFGNIEETKMAFRALESIRYQVSPFYAIISGASFKKAAIDWESLRPMIILYAVLAVLALALWIFILKRKPKRISLEDAKKQSDEKFSDVKRYDETEE